MSTNTAAHISKQLITGKLAQFLFFKLFQYSARKLSTGKKRKKIIYIKYKELDVLYRAFFGEAVILDPRLGILLVITFHEIVVLIDSL